MKRNMRRMLATVMAFVMMLGVFAGTGVTANAAGIPAVFSVKASDVVDGKSTITVTGENLTETVWWKLEKKVEDSYQLVGAEKVKTASTSSASAAEFTVDIPANTSGAEETYRVTVKESDPTPSFDWLSYSWTNDANHTASITVPAGAGSGDGGATEPEKVMCEADVFRAKVVDGNDKPLKSVTFGFAPTVAPNWPMNVSTDSEGVLEFELISDDAELEYIVKLNDTDYEGYVCTPAEMRFTVNEDAEISEVNGVAFEDLTDELVFKLTEGSEEPAPEVDKSDLNYYVNDYKVKADGYTAESYKAYTDAVAAGKVVFEDLDATQPEVNEAVKAIKDAIKALEKAPVCDAGTIRILVVDEDNKRIETPISFARYIGTSRGLITSKNGLLEYTLYPDDGYAKKIVIRYEGEAIEIDGVSYEFSPAEHEFTIDEDGSGSVITHIDGVALEGSKEVTFVLKEKVELADKTALETAIADAEKVEADAYTEDSFKALTDAIEAAKAVNADVDATQPEVDAAVEAINDAIAELKKVVNKEELESVIEKYYNEAVYSAKYWAALQSALDTAEAVNADADATQPEVDAAVAAVKKAAAYMMAIFSVKANPQVLESSETGEVEIKVNGTYLDENIWWKLEKKDGTSYTVVGEAKQSEATDNESGVTFKITLPENEAETDAVYRILVSYSEPQPKWNWDPNSELSWDAATKENSVEITVPAPAPVVNKDALAAAISTAEGLINGNYTDDSISDLEDALADAKSVKANENATQAEVDKALADLQAALDALEEKPVTPPAPENPFVDVKEGAYYYDPVLWAVGKNITNGTSETTFSPDKACTRAQVVTFLWRANGCPESRATSNPFKDVDSKAYYADAVLWAYGEGLVKGKTTTSFAPEDTVTRAEFVTILWRSEGKPAAEGANKFTDVKGGAYYEDAVLWAAESGVTEGTSATTFSPSDACTRAQVVTFLYRLLGDRL